MASRGVSKGKWNAPGGKLEGNESPEENAVREVREETGLSVSGLFYHGLLNFHLDGKEELSFGVHLFSTKDFSGETVSTDEGEVRWFDLKSLPMDQMWADDEYWLDLMLKGRRFDAEFYLDNENKNITKYSVSFLK